MAAQRIVGYLEKVLRFFLSALLLFSALVFFFVFAINWEDWFFGMKLDGMAAGIHLLVKGILAALLLYLLTRYPGNTLAITGLSTMYFGYLFIDSAVTVQTLTKESFSPLLLIGFIIPVIYLIIQIIHLRCRRTGYEKERPV
jgi:hypothetical protein